MSTVKSTTSPAPTNGSLTMLQASVKAGEPIGHLRADPTFPLMRQGTFDEAAVVAWIKSRDERAAQQSTPTAPPPVDSPNSQPDRRAATTDRRTPRV